MLVRPDRVATGACAALALALLGCAEPAAVQSGIAAPEFAAASQGTPPFVFPAGCCYYNGGVPWLDRKSTRLNSSHRCISYAVFCLKKKKRQIQCKLVLETGE